MNPEQIEAVYMELKADERARQLYETYKEEAIRSLRDVENPNLNKTVTLQGANAGTPGSGVRAAESIVRNAPENGTNPTVARSPMSASSPPSPQPRSLP